ncbi:MAG: RNA polymerase sigma factor, partial [Gammaproteobacteria bacterium]|nr:RNA polymerase sigma factor [Gammaproteobacteria bacterium]
MVEPMETLDDECLAAQVRSGGQEAFTILIRRYEQPLVALIRSRMGTVDAVEDLLQETFVQAWMGLASQSSRNVRAWLYQVARNRCSDFLRSSQRRERVVDDESLAAMVNRL